MLTLVFIAFIEERIWGAGGGVCILPFPNNLFHAFVHSWNFHCQRLGMQIEIMYTPHPRQAHGLGEANTRT